MTEEILKVEHLNKFYDERQVLYNINFSLKKGEVLTLLGPSGSGKSTLLRTLNGLKDYKNGSIYFHEKKIDPSPKEWQILRQKTGMVFQSYDLFPNITVIENVLLAPVKVQKRDENEVKEEAIKLLKQVGLEQYLNAYPRELSGGQKQRVAIVRALAMIIVTHQMNFASRIVDEVLFLEDGHILEDTPGKEFFNHPQTQRAKDFLDSMDY